MMEVMISFPGCFKSAVVPHCELVWELQTSVMVAAASGQEKASPQGALSASWGRELLRWWVGSANEVGPGYLVLTC